MKGAIWHEARTEFSWWERLTAMWRILRYGFLTYTVTIDCEHEPGQTTCRPARLAIGPPHPEPALIAESPAPEAVQ